MQYNVGDYIENLGEISRVSEHFIWIGNKRFKPSTLKNKNIQFKTSPNLNIDWTNENEVDNYYTKFRKWESPVRNGDSKKSEILQVKNNKVFYNGEYYLPYYWDKFDGTETPKLFLNDCYIFGFCVKIINSFYTHLSTETVNVFYIEKILKNEDISEQQQKEYNFKNLNTLDYLKGLNFRKINSNDLNLLKENILNLCENSLPFKYDGVEFNKGNFNRIQVSYRNRIGHIEVDNGYYGSMPNGNDYYLILKIYSCHFNECKYTVRLENNFTFDENMFKAFIPELKLRWDIAINENAKYYA